MSTPVTLPFTELHRIRSRVLDLELEICVQIPPVQNASRLPVVIGTDGNLFFATLAQMSTLLLIGGEIPPALVVSISYVIGDDPGYVQSRRIFDLSPSTDQWQLDILSQSPTMSPREPLRGGNAEQFFRFIEDELWPWIEQRYPVGIDRTYFGDSMGGLFGTYVLFKHPGFFMRYVLGSPWLCWDKQLCFGYEEEFAAKHDDLDAIVFFGAGGAEDVLSTALDEFSKRAFIQGETATLTKSMHEKLLSRRYPRLRLSTHIFDEQTHFTVPPVVMTHGLRFVFQATRV